jgi:hypothetical protein
MTASFMSIVAVALADLYLFKIFPPLDFSKDLTTSGEKFVQEVGLKPGGEGKTTTIARGGGGIGGALERGFEGGYIILNNPCFIR